MSNKLLEVTVNSFSVIIPIFIGEEPEAQKG